MSTLINRPTPVAAGEIDSQLTWNDGPRHGRNRVLEWMRANSTTLWWLSPIVLVAGIANAINFAGAPAISGTEVNNSAAAWSIVRLGEFGHYSYTYSDPPLGWLQIAAWTGLTGGFSRYAIAVTAAREAMVVATLVSVVLVWFLARRIGLGRAASAVATILFALSPLAIDLHRSVYLDNLATPWLLASLLLATSHKKQLAGFAGSAVALAIAALTQETYLLALPLVAILAWRNAHPKTRQYALAIAATTFVLIWVAYITTAVSQGLFFPSSKHSSLIGGLTSQFSASGSDSNLSTRISTTLGTWWALDPVQFVIAPVAAVAGLLIRRIRPFAVTLILLIALALAFGVGGYLPLAYVILLIPIAAIAVGGVADAVIRFMHALIARSSIRLVSALAGGVVVVAVLVSIWGSPLGALLFTHDTQASTTQAEKWVIANVPKDSRLIVDNSMWVTFVSQGFTPDNVVWFTKLDTDAAVKAQSPQGWKDSDYIVSTTAMRAAPHATSATSAIRNSVVVASFGSRSGLIQIRKIEPAGISEARAQSDRQHEQRATLGSEVSENPAVLAGPASLSQLRAGRVDPRISLLIAQLTATGAVDVSGFPVIDGESPTLIREVLLSRVNGLALSAHGQLTAAGRAVAASLSGPFATQSTTATTEGLLVEFPIDLPASIIQ